MLLENSQYLQTLMKQMRIKFAKAQWVRFASSQMQSLIVHVHIAPNLRKPETTEMKKGEDIKSSTSI